MQPRLPTSFIIFFGSYLPLSLILFVQNIDYSRFGDPLCWRVLGPSCEVPLRNPWWAFGMVAASATCFALTLAMLAMIRPNQPIVVREAKYIPADLMNYTLPYIVSFMSIDYQDHGKFIGFAVFLAWMFWLSHRSGQIIMNPVLIAMGWRLYELSYSFAGSTDAHPGQALVKGQISSGPVKQSSVQDIQIIKP